MTVTKAECFTQLAQACKIAREIYKFAALNSPNYVSMEDALIQALEGPHNAQVSSALINIKSSLSQLFAQAGAGLTNPILISLAELGYLIPPADVSGSSAALFYELQKAMIAAGETISSRVITRGNVAVGGSNVGNGKAYRCTFGRNAVKSEVGHMGVVRITCVKDKNNGVASGNEVFKIEGVSAGSGVEKNNVDYGDAGNFLGTLNAMGGNSSSLLSNPSFDQLPETLTTNENTGWTFDDYTKFAVITMATTSGDRKLYRLNPNTEANLANARRGQSLAWLDEGKITQYVARQNFKLNDQAPYFLIARIMRRNSADGTLTIRLGNNTKTLDITTLTNDVWSDIFIGCGTSAADAATGAGWYSSFKEDWPDPSSVPSVGLGVRISFELSANTTAGASAHQLVIDEIILKQAVPINGCYYLMTNSQVGVDFTVNDTFSFTDTATEAGTMAYVLARAFNADLNTTSGSPTYADA